MFAIRLPFRSFAQVRYLLCLGLAAMLLPGLGLATDAPPNPTAAAAVILPLNDSSTREHSTKKKIKKIDVNPPGIVRARLMEPAFNSVVFVAESVGRASVKLTDENDKVDEFAVVVAAVDISPIRDVVRRAVPTANIRIDTAGNDAIILSGTVDDPVDIVLVRQAVKSMAGQGIQILDGLRAGGGQQVQLDVVVVRAQGGLVQKLTPLILKPSGKEVSGEKRPLMPKSGTLSPEQASRFLNVGGELTIGKVIPGAQDLPMLIDSELSPNQAAHFKAFLNVLKEEKLATILAEPRLVTVSGRQASFLCGGESAIPVPAGLGSVGVQFEEFGTRLNLVPVVLGNGKIRLEVEPEVSALDPSSGTKIQGTIVPGRSTQRVRTTLELKSGQTMLLVGLRQHTVTGKYDAVPLLRGTLPIGLALWNRTITKESYDTVLLITPTILK